MDRRAWGWLGVVIAFATITIVWITAETPILGSRALNWITIIGLCVFGSYAFRRSQRP